MLSVPPSQDAGDRVIKEALWLIKRKMYPVPVFYRRKKPPMDEGWPDLRISESDVGKYFGSGQRQNIGVLLGIDGLCDIDLDCLEAIRAADDFLPPTDLVFGRKSAPGAHRLYRLDQGIPTRRFADPITKDVLLELRCLTAEGTVGCQTVVPPSTHPSGEPIRYAVRGKLANVKAADLLRATKRVAAVALLARHWPGEKSGRNETFLALAGVLARAGVPLDRAIRLHSAIYRILWNEAADLAQAAREVEATYEKLARGESVTAFTSLVSCLPKKVVDKALGW